MNSKTRPLLFLCLTILVLSTAATGAYASTFPIWTDFDEALLDPVPGTRLIVPDVYRTVELDLTALQAVLALAPLEFTGGAPVFLELPMPDGSFQDFQIEESPIMEPLLALRYPLIKTYRGRGIDDPAATTRFGLTSAGFHAIILAPSGTVYIDSYSRGDLAHYISYYKRDYPRDPSYVWECEFHDANSATAANDPSASTAQGSPAGSVDSSDSSRSNNGLESSVSAQATSGAAASCPNNIGSGDTLRTYRLAQAANYEYTQFHSGPLPNLPSKAAAINNGIIPTINRVNSIYERDLSAHLNLIDDLELIVWDTPVDPYTNESGTNMLVENQAAVDALIGPDNYDIGHVFSTGGGGVAFLGSLCDDGVPSLKAGGVTGLPAPTGDPFSVDYVAHEMGHQFGGNHTFNGSTGSCAGGNRNASTAYEVGSGATIQAYAGICSPQNLQSNSDDYFHLISYIEMRNHMTGSANGCGMATATGNTPPTVEAGTDFTIPARTPFTLTAVGSDPEGDAITYGWEEFDLGPAGAGTPDNGSSPIFRSFSPVPSPARTFPKLSDILNNTTTYGEILPTTNRTMKFRVSARDNNPAGGEVCWDQMQVQVVNSAGPFLVNLPNGGEIWTGTNTESVIWDVANTTATPISTPSVDIWLSTDGGLTFPILLAANVPNSGSASVAAPNIATDNARIKVQGTGNIFFDISDAVFSIQLGSGGTPFAADDFVSTPYNTALSIDVLANDSDPENDPLTITFVQSPTAQGGTAVLNAGQILYTPPAGYSGLDTFSYTISDGTSTDSGTVAVTVDPPIGGCEVQPAALEVSALANGFAPLTGDGDVFIDNCENADLSFSVANTGGPDLTNVRIVEIRSISHPDFQIHTALPAAIASSIASSCGVTSPGTGTFNFTASGLTHGDTVLFEIDVTSDQIAPFFRTFSLQLVDAESDVTVSDVTFDFEADENGWQVVSGTFDRLPPGADGTLFSMASSAGADDACDLVRSPSIRVSAASTLSLFNQYAIEPADESLLGFYDRANVGLFDPATTDRSVVIPDGGANPYNVPDGAANGGCAEGEGGWAGAAPFGASTWSASALGVDTIGPAGRVVRFDIKYGTDSLFSLAGIQFDQVVVTNVLELVADAQPDDTCPLSELVALDDTATTPEDTPITIDVLANDSDSSAEFLVVQSITQGDNGSVANNGSDVTYTPNPNFNGSDSFTYEVCNQVGDCATANVSVSVTPVNDDPVASNDIYTTDEDTQLTVSAPGVLGNDEDVDGDALSASLLTGPTSGTLALNADGSLSYTPNSDFNGSDSFTYEACDAGNSCDAATVSITVAAVNDGPEAADDSSSTAFETPVTIDVLANDSDLDGDPLVVGSVTQGSNGSVSNNGTDVIYTPDLSFSGADSFTYEACDDGDPALCSTATVTVTVQPDGGGSDDSDSDSDDFDSDGERDDEDSDDDNDGDSDNSDSDDDNDGIPDDIDSDDDNDGIADEFDDQGMHEHQSKSSGSASPNSAVSYPVSIDGMATLLVALVEGPGTEAMIVEINDPSGTLIVTSVAAPGRALATIIPVVAGDYTVTLKNPTAAPISYSLTSLVRSPW